MDNPISPDIKEMLEQQKLNLMKMVKLSARFSAALVKHDVLLYYQVDEIKVSAIIHHQRFLLATGWHIVDIFSVGTSWVCFVI